MAPNNSFDALLELCLDDPPKGPPIVDIIVPIYNAYDFLVSMLNSLEQTKVPYALFLINDCSTDERITPLSEYLFQRT